MVFHKPSEVRLDSLFGVGFSVLEYAKKDLYEAFFFQFLPAYYSCTVALSDTGKTCYISFSVQLIRQNALFPDSLLLIVKHKPEESAISPIMQYLDTSNFPIDHPHYSQKHSGELGYWKSEVYF